MASVLPHRVPVSPARRFVIDLMHASRNVPFIPVRRRMQLTAVADARLTSQPRPGWCALFVRAYALVASRRPELRRAYLPFLQPHFYEHPESVAAIAVERRVGDENAVLIGSVRGPEQLELVDLDARVRRFKEEPVESVGAFRRILALSRLPGPLRRLVWWWGLHGSGDRRARRFGTFAVSSVGSEGADLLAVRSPLTTVLSYGPMAPDGGIDVYLTFDHRVLDGATAARALADLEATLHDQLLPELRRLRSDDPLYGESAWHDSLSANTSPPRSRPYSSSLPTWKMHPAE